MHDEGVELELTDADEALYQLRLVSQALDASLQLRLAGQSQQLAAAPLEGHHTAGADRADANSTHVEQNSSITSIDSSAEASGLSITACKCDEATSGLQRARHVLVPEPEQHDQQASQHAGSEDSWLLSCQCSSFVPSATTSSVEAQTTQPVPKLASPKQPPLWKQQVQHEKQELLARQRHAAAEAAARQRQHVAQQQAADWQAGQQQLPFQVQHSHVPSRVTHKLHKTLSMVLRDADNKQQPFVTAAEPGQLTVDVLALPAGNKGPTALHTVGSSSTPKAATAAGHSVTQSASSPSSKPSSTSSGAGCLRRPQDTRAHNPDRPVPAREHSCRQSTSKGRMLSASDCKQQAWASADAQTDAEVDSYLLGHWQQHNLATAALVLQCAWRSRVARLAVGRYLSKRHASVHASLQPACLQWHNWSKASAHHRCYQQRAVLQAWRELLQLQAKLCAKVLRGLQRGVLSGEVPALMMWRLCTSSLQEAQAVRPSLGGMLASIMLHRIPRMRQQECLAAWRQVCQSQAALRARAHRMLTAVLQAVQRRQLQQALRFWLLYTASCTCERLKLQLPAYTQDCEVFDAWLWKHEQRQHMQQQAAGLAGRLGVLRCFVAWHGHVHKMRVMRAAWSGLLLHSPHELVRGGMSAFKANWKEERLHRRLMTAAVGGWLDLVDRNKAVAAVRKRIIQVAERRRKMAGMEAFKRFARMSSLLSAAAVLKQWQARPLTLAHLHAWCHDTLHATFYLCWWRWRCRAVARLRWRAALGLHMYRSHWLSLELAFSGWRKIVATASGQQGTERLLQASTVQDSSHMLGASDAAATNPASSSGAGPPGVEGTEDAAAAAEPTLPVVEASLTAGHEEPAEFTVPVSLADYPVGHPWRALLQRRAVLAPRGLHRLSGLHLGRALKDLRELEGNFIIKDSNSSAGGLLSSRVFARAAVSPGLKAMVTAQLPMNLLWRSSFHADKFWWQRVVGLMQHHIPHPDSWAALISSPYASSTNGSSATSNSTSTSTSSDTLQELQDLLNPRHSTAKYKCTCSRCPAFASVQATAVAEVTAKPAADAAAAMARTRLRLRAGLKLNPLQVPDGTTASTTAAATPATAKLLAPAAAADATAEGTSDATAAGDLVPGSSASRDSTASSGGTSAVSGRSSSSSDVAVTSTTSSTGGSSGSSGGAEWPVGWTCEDVAGLCRLVRAEELLETSVHLLLGIGADSSSELYDKLQKMSRGQQTTMQGDLLVWLLSAAFAHDSTHSQAVLVHARARDELLMATMELRERAMALHLHIPHKFTLNTRREHVDVRASWASVICKVEQERDWDASSADEDPPDPREPMWASLLAHHPQQQPAAHSAQDQQQQQQMATTQAIPGSLPWPASSGTGTTDALSAPLLAPHQTLSATGTVSTANMPVGVALPRLSQQGPPGQQGTLGPPLAMPPGGPALLEGPGGVQAVVLALANAAAGTWLRSAGAGGVQEHLAPGIMLAQASSVAGSNWVPDHISRSQTPASGDSGQQVQQQQQQDAQQQVIQQEQQRAKQKQQQQHKQAMAAAQGLFGSRAAAPAAGTGFNKAKSQSATPAGAAAAAAAAQYSMGLGGIEAEVFSGPGFLPMPGASRHSSQPVSGSSTSRCSDATPAASQPLLAVSQASNTEAPGQRQPQQQSMHTITTTSSSNAGPEGMSQAAAAEVTSAGEGAGLAAEASIAIEAELQQILTDLLTPLLGQPAAADAGSAGAAASACAAGDNAPTQGVAGPLDASGVGRCAALGAGSSALQGERAAAEVLAGACIDWVLHPEQQQQQLSQVLSESSLQHAGRTDAQPTAQLSKPRSAPSNMHAAAVGYELPGLGTHSSSNSSSSSSSSAEASRRSSLAHTSRSIKWRSASTRESDTVKTRVGSDASPDESTSWLALAVQQGLLPPTHLQLVNARPDSPSSQLSQQTFWGTEGQAGYVPGALGSEDDMVTRLQLQATVNAELSSSQEPSAASSVLEVPTSSTLAPTQQLGQQARPGTQQNMPHNRANDVDSKSVRQAPHAVAHVLRQQQGTLPPKQQQQQQRQRQPEPEPQALALLPQVAAALQALQYTQADEQQTATTQQQQQLLQGLQQALTLLEPAQLQEQVQLLLQAQRQANAARQRQANAARQRQQQLDQVVPITPWGGELQLPEPGGGATSPSGPSGAAGILSCLLTSPLNTRVAFWQQVAGQQPAQSAEQLSSCQQPQLGGLSYNGDSTLSRQLHQLAWSSILLARSARVQQQQQQQQQQEQQTQRFPGPGEQLAGPGPQAAMRQKLHTYLAAHMQWRRQQQNAPPLAPAEKWVTLEHEEQVLEFITSMTIAVHQQLLCKHLGLSATHQQPVAFGSSSGGARGSTKESAAAAAAAAARRTASIQAAGSRVDLSASRRLLPTVPRKAPARLVPVYIVPKPALLGVARSASAPYSPRQPKPQFDRLEPLQGWATEASETLAVSYGQQLQQAAARVELPRLSPGATRRHVDGADDAGSTTDRTGVTEAAAQKQSLGRGSSFASSASSWAG